MNPSAETLTLALVLTAAGVTVASALVTGLVQLLKSAFGTFLDGRERLTAFTLSGILVILAYLSVTVWAQPTVPVAIEGLFAAFLAFYGIARLSMAHYDDVTGKVNSLRGPSEQ